MRGYDGGTWQSGSEQWRAWPTYCLIVIHNSEEEKPWNGCNKKRWSRFCCKNVSQKAVAVNLANICFKMPHITLQRLKTLSMKVWNITRWMWKMDLINSSCSSCVFWKSSLVVNCSCEAHLFVCPSGAGSPGTEACTQDIRLIKQGTAMKSWQWAIKGWKTDRVIEPLAACEVVKCRATKPRSAYFKSTTKCFHLQRPETWAVSAFGYQLYAY